MKYAIILIIFLAACTVNISSKTTETQDVDILIDGS